MKNRKLQIIFNVLYIVSTLLALLGAFFLISDYDFAHIILIAGALVGIWTLIIENSLLKKRISQLEKNFPD